jgi:hypothetical protein
MLPLLKNPPDAQNVSETTFIGVAIFVSKFHRAPHADAPSIISGSFEALSKKRASVGETIIASRAKMPEVPFCTKFQPEAATEAAPRQRGRRASTYVYRISRVSQVRCGIQVERSIYILTDSFDVSIIMLESKR